MSRIEYLIDGSNFDTLVGFYEEISKVLIPGATWGHNLDAFNDILCGGFGTPAGGFRLVWRNSDLSRERLGYSETVRALNERLKHCHPTAINVVAQELRAALREEGPTVFDWLVEIVRRHPEIELAFE